MTRETRCFIEFQCPGAFVVESYREPTATFDPYGVAWPKGAHAFAFFERDVMISEDGREFFGAWTQIGPVYYHPDSWIETADQVLNNPASTATLKDNVRYNGFLGVVHTRFGNVFPFVSREKLVILEKCNVRGERG